MEDLSRICNWRSLSKANIVMCPMLAIEGRFTMKRITEEGLSRKPGTSDLRCVTPDLPSTPYILTNFKPKCLKFKSVVKSARLKPHINSKIYCRALFEPHIEGFSKKSDKYHIKKIRIVLERRNPNLCK